MVVRSIWAQSRTRAIGGDGGMLWNLPEDMAYFRRATTGSPVVMGRKTWLSFPARFRPLPGRPNLVVTRDDRFGAHGATVMPALDEAVRTAKGLADDVWIIGGAQIYAQAMAFVDELWVTEVDTDVDGDARAPAIGAGWEALDPDAAWLTSRTGLRYRFLVYRARDGSRSV